MGSGYAPLHLDVHLSQFRVCVAVAGLFQHPPTASPGSSPSSGCYELLLRSPIAAQSKAHEPTLNRKRIHLQRKPRSHEWGTRERETHNDRCERCSLGGQVVECFTCNTVWHRTCTGSLPSKGPTLQYWQCDTCVEEETAKYGTTRDQLRLQQPAITAAEGTETATAEVVQIADCRRVRRLTR